LYLYLVRHAVAHGRDPERWPDDSERPLTPEGEEDFRAVAQGLGQVVPRVDALLSSPYARAWRTAEILAGLKGWLEPKAFPALEPNMPPHKGVLALHAYDAAEAVALVGHRPCLHELSSYLITGREDGADIKIKKGGVVCISFDGLPDPGVGKLRWLFTPKILRS